MLGRIKNIRRMIYYCENTEPGIIISGVLSKISNVLRPFIFLIISKILINSVIIGRDFSSLLKNILILLFIYFILSITFSFFENRYIYHVQCFLRKHNMRKSQHLLEINYQWTEDEKVQTRLSELLSMERKNVFGLYPFTLYINKSVGAIVAIAFAIYMSRGIFFTGSEIEFITEWKLDLAFIGLFILSFFSTLMLLNYINRSFSKAIESKANKILRYLKPYDNLIYRYKTAKDIRLYHEETAKAYSEKYRNYTNMTSDIISGVFTKSLALETLAAKLTSGIIYLFVGIKVLHGAISISEVLLFIGIFNQIVDQGTELADGLGCLKASDIYRKQLFEYYNLGRDQNNQKDKIKSPTDKDLSFRLQDVSFSYPGSQKKVLENISFKIKAGERLAIVGTNGSGKTTLIKLLTGLYDDYQGQILMNNNEIRDLEKQSYQKNFSPVFQDFRLLALTLKENVGAFKEISSESLSNLMEQVGMGKFYEKHKDNVYLTKEFEASGVEISGGEAQKIALARAIQKNGQVYILDEPTAALDPISEYEIYSKFKEMTEGKTTIFISHRLSSCTFCDSIVVLDKGKLVQLGSHDELLKDTKGKYYELWNSQAKYYKKA